MKTTMMSEIPTQGENPGTCTMVMKMNPIRIPSASNTTNWARKLSRRMLQLRSTIPAVEPTRISAKVSNVGSIIYAVASRELMV